jgi:acetolactate synthase-1/2/3 large subunit
VPTVADLLIQGLRQAGAERVFVVPGRLSASLLAAAHAHGLAPIRVHSDSAACLMAATTGELTGAPGAAIVGGAVDAVPGLAHAQRDRAPMIAIAKADPMAAALSGAVVKERLVVTPDSVAHWIAHAAQLAVKEPQGPVLLELGAGVAEATAVPVATNPRRALLPAPDGAALDAAAAMIVKASRPLVVTGLGCRAEDAGWVRAFAEALPAPVLSTLKAKGTMPEPHPLSLGVFGVDAEAPVVRRADLIIAIGLDDAELGGCPWPSAAPVLHIGRAAHAGESYRAAVEILGEPGLILDELAPRLRGTARADWDVAEVDRLKREHTARVAPSGPGLTAETVVRIARELTEAGAIAAIDGGEGMLGAALAWQAVARGECLVPNGLATPGFALPAAVAAQLVHPGRRILCVARPAGLLRALAELETAARLGLPIVIVALDDEPGFPDLTAIARAFGVSAQPAPDAETARRALFAALGGSAPFLVAAQIARREKAVPALPAALQ